ncbi:glycosyltransferase family 2 protein [Piscinibacter sp.]|uniref:glycosyltransferase family 2 protein n=1 Tax=Piscinibacter sp. TaxID=1903157 RepID=UPI0039E3A0F0
MTSPSAPLVSVCVATYKQDRYIEECLLSVLAQAGDVPIEVLVGNDGDSPDTPHIVARLSARFPGVIRYFAHERNLGASRNYQFLVREARGYYIAHLDGDDYWLPGKLRAQIALLEERPDSPACYANAVVIDDAGRLLGAFTSFSGREIDLPTLVMRGNFLNHSSLLYRASHRDVVLDISDEWVDYRLHLGFARRGVLSTIDRVLVVYRSGSEQSMIDTMADHVHERVFEAMCTVLPQSSIVREVRRSALGTFWAAHLIASMRQRRRRPALYWYRRIRDAFPQDAVPTLIVGVYIAGGRMLRAVGSKLWRGRSSVGALRVLFER